uniref:Uncharacterized protein n=1 Tax=Anguilla anguilla TaxID=7936 RepID=A0A0E9TM43_ANGAN
MAIYNEISGGLSSFLKMVSKL